MTLTTPPIPANETSRIYSLAEFDLDYSDLQANFKDLVLLAAKVAGTSISLVNLIDTYTQWTVSQVGLDIKQMPREDSVCQYTIAEDDHLTVDDLTTDERFKNKFYVNNGPKLKFYHGVPLKTNDGQNIGALCVMDPDTKELSSEKTELLKIIAGEIVNRLNTLKAIDDLKNRLAESKQSQKKVAHDIRGPLSGIIGLAKIISDQGSENRMDEVLEFINLIHRSGNSILDLADEILSVDKTGDNQEKLSGYVLNLVLFKEKIEQLYRPQAIAKNINFKINISHKTELITFSKDKLLQITGNLVSNAMKFTPEGGDITVDLNLVAGGIKNTLQIIVTDSGIGIDGQGIDFIMAGDAASTQGTGGEEGYGFGLALVKHLVDKLEGKFKVKSILGQGSIFEIVLPQNRN